jgi:ABC-type polysaccharide/polyol phosphate transport system ATPase subunit
VIILKDIKKRYSSKEQKYIGKYFLRNIMADVRSLFNGKEDDKYNVLKGISLEINKGEHVGIIGRNKAGKSTLLQLISGISAPTGGSLMVEGNIIPVFGQGNISTPDMTGREYLRFYAAALGASKKQIASLEQSIIDFSEITQIDTPVKFYSTGTRTRLSLATTLLLPADIYILDEVFYGSDVFFKEKIAAHLNYIQQHPSITTIMVSHHEEILKKFCQRLILIEEGRLIADGGVDDVLAIYNSRHIPTPESIA